MVKEGKAIINGGATSTLGSEEAMQNIAKLRWDRYGKDGIEIKADAPPSFRFGNNAKTNCMSTAMLDVALDGQDGNLLSIKALRASGAVVDYGADEILLKNINAYKVAKLEAGEWSSTFPSP